MIKKAVLSIIIAIMALTTNSNNYFQTIRGQVVDMDSKVPIFGVNIFILGSNPPLGASTDIDGNFKIESVSVGRISLQVSCLGYETRTIHNVIVGTGKEVILNIELEESLIKLDEVEIKAKNEDGRVNNEMSLISARQVTVEETQRFAGSLDDPSRMVSAFAGVNSDPMGNNDIIVRGNSPKGILWRMEGIEIPNPNHFSDESTTGGPINALSSNMLANSDFLTGAFAPEYGNVLSGVFDVRMRTGNNEKPEYTLGVGVLGVDIAAEGPFKKGYSGSYLANYRYSSLSLLDQAGLVDFGGIPRYQDLTFKLNLPTQKFGSFSLFGLGGLSGLDDQSTDDEGVVLEKFDYRTYMGTVGLVHFYMISDKSYIKTTLSASANGSKEKDYELMDGEMTFTGEGKWNKVAYRAAVTFNHKFNSKHSLMAGVKYTHFVYDMEDRYFDDEDEFWKEGVNVNRNAGLVQAFANWKYRINEDLTMVGGLHYTQFLLNNASAIEPRLALNWKVSPGATLSAGYGQHSMVESIITYYSTVYDENFVPYMPNKNLELTKSDHYIIGYDQKLSDKIRAKVEVYYQYIHDVPVENVDTSYFSMINNSNGYVDKYLVNDGVGYNYGVELTLERYFSNSYYFLVTGSLFESKYKAKEGVWRNTRFNTNYAANFLVGKEFTIGKADKGNNLNLNLKVFTNGGSKYIPIDLEASQENGYSVYQYEKAYESSLDKIFQVNFTASYSINRPKVRHEIFLDIYNVTNSEGRVWEYYDKHKGQADYYGQLNMIPNIMYKLHF